MNPEVHDLARFPFVSLRSEQCRKGFAVAWSREMDALLAAGKPFTVAFEPSSIDEDPEDFKQRALWFKTNRELLPGRCAGMIVIVASATERTAMETDLAKRSRGFGTPYLAMASFDAAAAATPALIAQMTQAA